MKKLILIFAVTMLLALGTLVSAELPRGEYDIEVDGVTLEGMSFLVTENISGNAGCVQTDTTTTCYTHAWNDHTNYFIADGLVLLMLGHNGSGFLGDSLITFRPICDGFSPEPAGCQ